MARYFMHLRNGVDELLDEEGREYRTLDYLRNMVMRSARDVICGDVIRGEIDLRHRIDVEDEKGFIAYTLEFRDAVAMVN